MGNFDHLLVRQDLVMVVDLCFLFCLQVVCGEYHSEYYFLSSDPFTGKNQNFRKFQEYTTGTMFEANIVNEEVISTMRFSNGKKIKLQSINNNMNSRNDGQMMRLNDI